MPKLAKLTKNLPNSLHLLRNLGLARVRQNLADHPPLGLIPCLHLRVLHQPRNLYYQADTDHKLLSLRLPKLWNQLSQQPVCSLSALLACSSSRARSLIPLEFNLPILPSTIAARAVASITIRISC